MIYMHQIFLNLQDHCINHPRELFLFSTFYIFAHHQEIYSHKGITSKCENLCSTGGYYISMFSS